MKNSMAKEFAKRYEEYLHTTKLEERAARSIYYFVMSTLEFLFWSSERKAERTFKLFASERIMLLVYRDRNGEKHEIMYKPTENCGNGRLTMILDYFVEMFNNIDYPLTQDMASPVFSANYDKNDKWNLSDKYKGYDCVYIHMDMLPDADDDPCNRGYYA